MRLDLAFTGAVSHSGQIMAVGGVTRKIEGFFKVCARHGLTGSQGVIIPHDNVDHLMLSPDVLQAVEKGQFAIYAVRSIEEALTLPHGAARGAPPQGRYVHARQPLRYGGPPSGKVGRLCPELLPSDA